MPRPAAGLAVVGIVVVVIVRFIEGLPRKVDSAHA